VCTSVGVSGSWFPRRETSCYSISRSLQVPARRLEAPAVGISGSWFLRREISCYVPGSCGGRSAATAPGVFRFQRGDLKLQQLESQVHGSCGGRPEATAPGVFSYQRGDLKLQQLESQVPGSCGGRPEVPTAGTGGARQATTLFKVRTVERGIFDRLMFKMHYSKLLVKIRPSCFLKSWMQCLSKIFSPKAASAAAG